jgi:hypothetical protein
MVRIKRGFDQCFFIISVNYTQNAGRVLKDDVLRKPYNSNPNRRRRIPPPIVAALMMAGLPETGVFGTGTGVAVTTTS